MGISSIGLGNNQVEYVTVESRVITKISKLGRNTLDYLVRHQYTLAVCIWSYLAIEVGALSMETLQEGYIYDVDSCRERLCNYWNNSTRFDFGFAPKYLESKCSSNKEELHVSYSFMKCLQDLCKYTKSIGEKFYACPKLPELSNTIVNFWDKFCPKKGNRSPNKLSELSYLNKCIKKLCKNKKLRPTLDKNIVELCETKSVEKLYEFLKGINKSLKKFQKSTENTDSWTQAGVIGAVVGGIAGLIGGAAGIASTIVTYQAGRAATAALGATVPTLSEGLQNIARTTADTALVLLRQTTSQTGQMIPMDTLDTLHELSAHIEEHSLSYYSVEETAPHKVESGNPSNINPLEISGPLGGEPGGAEVAGNSDLLGTAIGSNIIKNILANLRSRTTPRETEISLSTMLSTIEQIEPYSQTTPDPVQSSISLIKQVPELTRRWITYMKNTLPYWHNSFCFYDRHINLFICRLPLPRHRSELKISFFVTEIHKFFSENVASLCDYFGVDLWCNWNQFLDHIFSKRNISFSIDKECPWDQFALKVNQVLIDTYRVDAIGSCHNETIFIKV